MYTDLHLPFRAIKPCHSDGTCPHQVRFGRVFALLSTLEGQILGQSALDVDRFRQNDKAWICI